MKALQKLVRNGNSTQLTIPRPVLMHLGWLPGDPVIVELLEDKTLHVRPFREAEHAVPGQQPLVLSPIVSTAR